MSTPSVPAKPDVPIGDPAAERRADDDSGRPGRPAARGALPAASPAGGGDAQPQSSPAQPLMAPPSDRTVDADLLIDIPQLSVEELALELEASLVLNRVKLDAKGLEAGLYVKANFDRIAALTQHGSESDEPGTSDRQRGSDALRVRTGLRELLGGTREPDERDTSGDEPAGEREAGEDDEDGREPESRHNGHGGPAETARHAITQGMKAAGLTAAGLAGGALLESRVKPSRTLHIPRRRSRMQVIRDEIGKRLP